MGNSGFHFHSHSRSLPPPSTLRKCELLPGGEFTSLAAHTLSLSRLANHGPAKQPRDRGLIVNYCHSGTGSSTAGTAGGAPRQLSSLFQAPRQLSSLFQAPRQLSMSSLLQACHAPSLLQALRGLASLLQAPRQSCHPRQSAPSPRVSALPRLQSFPRLQPSLCWQSLASPSQLFSLLIFRGGLVED